MRTKSKLIFVLTGATLVFPCAAVAQQRAIRHGGTSCFGNKVDWIDVGTATLPDWGAVSRWRPDPTTPQGVTTNTILCPVSLDVPRTPGTPIDNVRIVYATREPFPSGNTPTTTGGPFTPTIESCTVYLMDGTAGGTWVQQSDVGANTGGFAYNGEINIPGGTVPLGGPHLNRMLITCQMPKTVTPVGGSSVPTAIIKGYEVAYTTSN